jgi:hypothetical protein
MLDYIKTVLTKVSFDEELFAKELRKALKTLDDSQASELKIWLKNQTIGFQEPVFSATLQSKSK